MSEIDKELQEWFAGIGELIDCSQFGTIDLILKHINERSMDLTVALGLLMVTNPVKEKLNERENYFNRVRDYIIDEEGKGKVEGLLRGLSESDVLNLPRQYGKTRKELGYMLKDVSEFLYKLREWALATATKEFIYARTVEKIEQYEEWLNDNGSN